MPAQASAPGFFGKLPSTGDFVVRNLPAGFTVPWDRWVARYLAALPADAPPLFFRRAGFSGVVLPSRDCAGRPFPLTLAVPGAPPPSALITLAAIGRMAVAQSIPADALAARLADHASPSGPPDSDPLLLWTDPAKIHAADPEAPADILAVLLGVAAGPG